MARMAVLFPVVRMDDACIYCRVNNTPLLILLAVVVAWAFRSLMVTIQTDLMEMEKRIMAKVNELAAIIDGLNTKVEKVRVEVQALKDSLSNVDLPADAQAALDRLTASIQTVDDINPDQPPPV